MSQTFAPPCLFLSHSGADTDAARELKRRLLDSPDARAAGLRVWLDKDDLAAGLGWQAQLERAISEEATAFAVHVGANGVVNWVEGEVRLGLSRATAASDYPFIPILAKECSGSAALPLFARQYQGVHDPLHDPEEFAKLVRTVLRRSSGERTVVLDSPFVGLKAMTEADADRFFGRNEEIDELVVMLKQHRLVAVVADSGAGKSSLALAGLVPHFRGGALSDAAGREPDGRLWHVVVMRPRRDPIEGLKRGVTEAAERLGRSTDQCAALRKRINASDPSETAYAIRCDLPVGTTETLLIVDQFEELLTETGEAQRASTVDLLMALEAIGDFRIVLTLRADHFNLCRPFSKLFEHLTRNSHESVLRLRRITDAGLIEAARTPLHLAGHTDVSEQDAVIDSIRRDITDRAGDLALVQMALYAMWQKHRADGVKLLVAYSQVGGVVGALAHEAERVRAQRLDATERPLLAPLLIRLVRLGETGGATRRTADLADFDGPRHTLATRLATEDCGRLLVTGERTVEIAHEALITQWPWLQNTLNEAAADMRVLDRLIDRARRWNTIGARSPGHLATGAELTEFSALALRRSDWLSAAERDFVAASEEEAEARSSEQRKQLEAIAAAQAERETALHEAEDALTQAADAQRKRARIRNIALVVVSILAVLTGLLGWSTEQQRKLAEQQRITAEKQTKQADDILGRATNIIAKLQTKMDDETRSEVFALFQTGAEHGDRTSMRNLGISYHESFGVTRDYAKAREWYEKAAAKDYVDAMTDLGLLYLNGRGVAQDFAKAREWYEKAAAKDNADAMTRLGLLYHDGRGVAQDFAKAREWYEKAAAKDNATAMSNLGLLYHNGRGVAQDFAKAREWYEKAVAKDYADAMTRLGELYHSGRGVAQDFAKAREWYEKAAAKDDAYAMTRLGLLYDKGQGVAQDFAKAREWYEKAAAKDDAYAMTHLGVLYDNGRGVAQDFAKAREWYEKAAAKDDADAMTSLGVLYHSGRGVAQDFAKAREWYEKAAAKDDATAMSNLGLLYDKGQGVAQDFAKAREWYEKAAPKEDADVMTRLGELYHSGRGVAQDFAKAREWYEKAAAKGDTTAQANLEKLSISEAAAAGRYADALQLQAVLAAKVEAVEMKREGAPGKETAGALGGMVWYAVLAREFAKALTVADRSRALFPDNLINESNRAHALLFLGREEEARALYLAYKGRPVPELDDRLWERAIVEDFAELRKTGLTYPIMADIEKELGVTP